MHKKFLLLIFSALIITSCKFDNQNDSDPSNKSSSIIRKWYINSEDDRYYYDFRSDGTLYYHYFQCIGSPTSGLYGFVTFIGTWSYINEEHTVFSVGWVDSVNCNYDIVEEKSDKLFIKKDINGPAGRGLGSITELLKSAKTVIFTVPEQIINLIGTWYYDDSKTGRYLKIQADGNCYYHYYQNCGGNLAGWVNINGIWGFDSNTGILDISMAGEVTYTYTIDELTTTVLLNLAKV
jgi:hypothetical protein